MAVGAEWGVVLVLVGAQSSVMADGQQPISRFIWTGPDLEEAAYRVGILPDGLEPITEGNDHLLAKLLPEPHPDEAAVVSQDRRTVAHATKTAFREAWSINGSVTLEVSGG